MSEDRLILCIPWMHPALAPELPACVRFLNPGLVTSRPGELTPTVFHTPQPLPLSPAQARRYLQDAFEFGDRFQHSGDMAFFSAGGGDEIFSLPDPGLRAELAELSRMADGQSAAPDSKTEAAAGKAQSPLKSQMALLLAWTLEEKILELAELADTLAASSRRFDAALGLDEEEAPDDADDVAPDFADVAAIAGVGDPAGLAEDHETAVASFPLGRSVEHLLTFLPADGRLFAVEPRLRAAWETSGAVLAPVAPARAPEGLAELAIAGRLLETTLSGWRLIGLARRPVERPDLDREYTVLYYQTNP